MKKKNTLVSWNSSLRMLSIMLKWSCCGYSMTVKLLNLESTRTLIFKTNQCHLSNPIKYNKNLLWKTPGIVCETPASRSQHRPKVRALATSRRRLNGIAMATPTWDWARAPPPSSFSDSRLFLSSRAVADRTRPRWEPTRLCG